MTISSKGEPVYAITLHQPWATLIAPEVKTVGTRSWPAPARLLGQRIAVHAGKRLVRRPGHRIERELRDRVGRDWSRSIPAGAVVATAVLSGMARVTYVPPDSPFSIMLNGIYSETSRLGKVADELRRRLPPDWSLERLGQELPVGPGGSGVDAALALTDPRGESAIIIVEAVQRLSAGVRSRLI